MSNTRVLLISCYFPPTGGVQVQRALSLAKYLPGSGIDLHILTTRNPSVPTFDENLLSQIPEEVRIHRCLTLEPPFHLRKRIWSKLRREKAGSGSKSASTSRLSSTLRRSIGNVVARALCPDPQVLWYPMAIRAADRIVRRYGIQAVLVTAPPFSAFLLGNELKRRHPSLTLITDIRDEWITYFAKTFAFAGDSYVMAKAAHIERDTVMLSDCVVPVTEAARDEIRSRYPDQPPSKFQVVPNGFDPAGFVGFRSRAHNTGRIVITYTGTVYAPADPAVFLDAMDALPEVLRARFEIRFIGRIAEEFDRRILEGRKTRVKVMGFVPQKEAFQYLEESDYLLLPWSDRLNVPGKLYEYIGTRKPVIAVVKPEADVVKVIRSTGTGWCVDRSDPCAIQALLMSLAAEDPATSLTPDEHAIRRFERPRLAREYADLIRGCCSSGYRSKKEEIVAASY
jgi:hypothetical protein